MNLVLVIVGAVGVWYGLHKLNAYYDREEKVVKDALKSIIESPIKSA